MIKGIIEPGSTLMIIGDTGIGKTTYALKIATCLLLGKRIPGLPFKNIGKAKHVLFLYPYLEVTEKKIKKLLKIFNISKDKQKAWQLKNKIKFEPFNSVAGIVSKSSDSDDETEKMTRYDYIIIDNLHRAIKRENEPQEIKDFFYDKLIYIMQSIESNPMIIVTHPAKDNRPRGHKAFSEWPRTTLLLRGEEEKKKVQIVRIKSTEKEKWENRHEYTIPEFKKLDKKKEYRLTGKNVQKELNDIVGFITKKKLIQLLVKKYKVQKSTAETNIEYAIESGMIIKDSKKGLKST